MKCTCGQYMRRNQEGYLCPDCGTFRNTSKRPVYIGFEKPDEPHNQGVNITDQVNDDLHSKPDK